MTKAKLEFDLDEHEDKLALKRALNADNLYMALNEIGNKIFRPARKYGYGQDHHVDKCINKAIEAGLEIEDFELEDFSQNVVSSAISKLERDFYEILEEYKINTEDLP